MSSKRMTANPVRAPRYRPGKSVPEDVSSNSDVSDAEEEQEPPPQPPSKPLPKFTSAGEIASNLSKVDLSERRKRAAAAEAVRLEEQKALRAKEEEGFVTEESEEEGSDDESEEESDEEESESEEEAPRKVLLRPTFIKKDKRNALGVTTADTKPDEEKQAEEDARRIAAADEIVEEQIRKDLAAKAAGKKNWDDEDEDANEVDDTDDIDPEAEHAAWKLRELKRIKRDREAIEERERQIAEMERRKNLTEEERKAEDDQHIALQKEEKDGKGKMSYLQKYYHKGAFFQDDLKTSGLDGRDIMGARFADDVQNRELLPQALQMRDMTKLGRKGATKYRDLKSEDTGRWGQFDDRRPRNGGGPLVDDERFRPDRGGVTGANSQPVGERRVVKGAPEGPRALRDGMGRDDANIGDTYRPGMDRDRGDRRTRSGSRSRSPRREGRQDDRGHRKRSYSRDRERDRERDRYQSDKRRRVDSR